MGSSDRGTAPANTPYAASGPYTKPLPRRLKGGAPRAAVSYRIHREPHVTVGALSDREWRGMCG